MTLPNFDLAKVQKFTDSVFAQAEQRQSFLRPLCKEKYVTGESWQSVSFGSVEAFEQTEYNEDMKYADVDTYNRWQYLRTFYLPILRDAKQLDESLLNIDGEFSKQVSAGIARQIDRVVRDAILGSYWSGKNGTTEVPWSNVSLNVTTSVGNTLDISSGGLTVARMTDIEGVFIDRGYLQLQDEMVYLVITKEQQKQLIGELNAAKKESLVYSRNGTMLDSVGRIKLITIPNAPVQGRALANVESSKTQLFAFTKDSVEIGIQKEVQFQIDKHPTKVNSHILKSLVSLNALRLDDAQVIKILA